VEEVVRATPDPLTLAGKPAELPAPLSLSTSSAGAALATPLPASTVGETRKESRPRRPASTILARDSALRHSLAAADCIALTLAVVLPLQLLGGGRLSPLAFLALPLVILIAKLLGLYDRDAHLVHRNTVDELPRLFQLATLTVLLLWLGGGEIAERGFGRTEALTAWPLLFVSLASLRSLARQLARRRSDPERLLFVGGPEAAAEFRQKLITTRRVNADLVGWLPAPDTAPNGASQNGDTEASDSNSDPGGNGRTQARLLVPRLRDLTLEHDIHRVVLAPGPGSSEDLVNAIRAIRDHGVKVSVLPRHARVAGSAVELDHLNGLTLLGVRRFEITASSRLVKRAFDLAGASLGLLLLSPLMAAITIAIRLDSPGPTLFRQLRAGRNGKPFRMFKFRSMVDGAADQQAALWHLNEADGVFKLADDPRITRVGRWIRRFSLDELPQLINVLIGDMSLVGPRPLPREEDRRVGGGHPRRLDLRPGITGPWQVLGTTQVPLREMANLDNQYVADWSLWTDLRILALTVPHVFGRRGL
jgi:exopolysaccharide biosynthesis polyprenyl glycosylphosphotransferase